MIEIRIDNTGNGTWWLYSGSKAEWKDYVGCECFDEQVVLFGNKDYRGVVDADWYEKAKEILNDIDCYDEYPEDLSEDVNAKLKELYDKCRCTEDILFDVIKLLNPEDTFRTGTINGYCQSEWQNYIVKGDVDVERLEAFYFEKIAQITALIDGEEDFCDVITHSELWKAENDDLEKFMRKRYKISDDEELEIFQADGMKQVVDWRQVD